MKTKHADAVEGLQQNLREIMAFFGSMPSYNDRFQEISLDPAAASVSLMQDDAALEALAAMAARDESSAPSPTSDSTTGDIPTEKKTTRRHPHPPLSGSPYLPYVAVTEASFPFEVTTAVVNGHGTLHGGASFWLIDTCTGLHHVAAAANIGGATMALTVAYHRPCPLGTKATVRTTLHKVGRKVSFMRGRIVDAADPTKIYAEGTHCVAPFWESHL